MRRNNFNNIVPVLFFHCTQYSIFIIFKKHSNTTNYIFKVQALQLWLPLVWDRIFLADQMILKKYLGSRDHCITLSVATDLWTLVYHPGTSPLLSLVAQLCDVQVAVRQHRPPACPGRPPRIAAPRDWRVDWTAEWHSAAPWELRTPSPAVVMEKKQSISSKFCYRATYYERHLTWVVIALLDCLPLCSSYNVAISNERWLPQTRSTLLPAI